MNTLTGEEKIWEAFKKGDPQAFKALYDHYVNALYAYGMMLCHDNDKVQDCIHDLFIALWDSRHSFSIPVSGKAYLMVSLRRRVFDKGPKLDSLTDGLDHLDENTLKETDHEARWILKESTEENNAQLQDAFNKLSDRQREIIHMKYFQELDYDEIGRIMGLNYQSARNLVTRALAALRKEMLLLVMILLMFT